MSRLDADSRSQDNEYSVHESAAPRPIAWRFAAVRLGSMGHAVHHRPHHPWAAGIVRLTFYRARHLDEDLPQMVQVERPVVPPAGEAESSGPAAILGTLTVAQL